MGTFQRRISFDLGEKGGFVAGQQRSEPAVQPGLLDRIFGFVKENVDTVANIISKTSGGRRRGAQVLASEQVKMEASKKMNIALIVAAGAFLVLFFLMKTTFLVAGLVAVALFFGIPLVFA